MKRVLWKLALLGAALAAVGSNARADTVITFDDLTGNGQLADGYGGVTWHNDWTYYDTPQGQYTPESGSERVYNSSNTGTRLQDSPFSFSAPVVFDGAYFAGYDVTNVSFELYLGGSLVATSASLSPSGTPAFLASGYSGLVDTVVVHDSNLFGGIYDYYVMDNVTYSTVTTPEPSTVIISLFGGLGMVGFAWRRRKSAIA